MKSKVLNVVKAVLRNSILIVGVVSMLLSLGMHSINGYLSETCTESAEGVCVQCDSEGKSALWEYSYNGISYQARFNVDAYEVKEGNTTTVYFSPEDPTMSYAALIDSNIILCSAIIGGVAIFMEAGNRVYARCGKRNIIKQRNT